MKTIGKYIRTIKTKRQYKDALDFIDKHFEARPDTLEGNLVEILAILIEKYEDEMFPIEAPDPIEAIKFRIEQMGLSSSEFARIIGGRNRASEIFNYKRSLSLNMIRKLNKELNIPAESLIHDAA
jgi:HTH-type transcriptional regulator / antitoxin HigA